MEQQHLAIASVPIQSWETLYDWEQALATGTIFPGLNKPFFVLEETPYETGFKPDENASPSSRRGSG
ncbi:MAG: spore coat associated protein CotJA [Blautia marasmi]